MRALRPKNPENITNFPGSFASAQNDSNEQKIPSAKAVSPLKRGTMNRKTLSSFLKEGDRLRWRIFIRKVEIPPPPLPKGGRKFPPR